MKTVVGLNLIDNASFVEFAEPSKKIFLDRCFPGACLGRRPSVVLIIKL